MRDGVQRGIETVGVKGDVAIVAEEQSVFIVVFAASFAQRAIETSPAFLQDDFGDGTVDAIRMITLAALRASDKTTFLSTTERTAT